MYNPVYLTFASFCTVMFFWLAIYSYENREQSYQPDVLGEFIDKQPVTFKERQIAALREVWGDNLNRNIFGE